MKQTIARWESKGHAHYVELYRDQWGYSYTGNSCGGSLGQLADDATAVRILQERVDTGYFQPDRNTSKMTRVR